MESGELGENCLLPMACAKERALECSSLVTLMRKRNAVKDLKRLARDLSALSWKSRVAERGLTAEDFRARFDMEFNEVDEDLFGLDLRDGNAVHVARRDAKEMRYVAERLGGVLGPERAQMGEYLDEIQRELGALSDARSNQLLAEEGAKSPRFRGGPRRPRRGGARPGGGRLRHHVGHGAARDVRPPRPRPRGFRQRGGPGVSERDVRDGWRVERDSMGEMPRAVGRPLGRARPSAATRTFPLAPSACPRRSWPPLRW